MDRCGEPGCGHEIPDREPRCPHCGRPGLYPNVQAAGRADERAALDQRHADTRRAAAAQGTTAEADAFARKVDVAGRAVIARPLGEVERLTRNDREVYSTYYRKIEAELQLPDEPRWDVLMAMPLAA